MRLGLPAGLAALCVTILLSVAWGKGDGFLTLIFVFLVPLLLFEHLSKRSIAEKFVVGLISFLLFHLVNGLDLFTGANRWVVLTLLFLDSLRMSLPWLVYVIAKAQTGLTSSLFLMGFFWLGIEQVSHSDWGCPWYILGNSLSGKVQWVQWYQFTGVLGGSLWILLVNTVLFTAVVGLLDRRSLLSFGTLLFGVLLMVGPTLFSKFLWNEPMPHSVREGVVVLATGTDGAGLMGASVGELITETEKAKSDSTRYIVWPESSIKSTVSIDKMDEKDALMELRDVTGGNAIHLICGARTVQSGDYYNSALIIRDSGMEVIHKSNLAPFGEYSPALIGWLELYGAPEYRVARWEGNNLTEGRVTVAICYETLFGENIAYRALQSKANVLVVLSNETDVQGAKLQLLQLSRLRAIETRKYVLRSAHNGMSAIIAPDGDLVSSIDGSGTHIRVLTNMIRPNALVTFYMEHGDYIGRSALWLSISIVALFLLKRAWYRWRIPAPET